MKGFPWKLPGKSVHVVYSPDGYRILLVWVAELEFYCIQGLRSNKPKPPVTMKNWLNRISTRIGKKHGRKSWLLNIPVEHSLNPQIVFAVQNAMAVRVRSKISLDAFTLGQMIITMTVWNLKCCCCCCCCWWWWWWWCHLIAIYILDTVDTIVIDMFVIILIIAIKWFYYIVL